jgi:hypothetical protein
LGGAAVHGAEAIGGLEANISPNLAHNSSFNYLFILQFFEFLLVSITSRSKKLEKGQKEKNRN